MEIDNFIFILEQMAENGQPPSEGCSLFGVGYEDAFQRIRDMYLTKRFNNGGSAEKFIVGPFGSGKTHFLRQLLEIARDLGCVTSEVPLSKDLDFTQSLQVYREIAQELFVPNGTEHGIRGLIIASVERIRSRAPDKTNVDDLLKAWVAGLDKFDFKNKTFGRVLRVTLQAHLVSNKAYFTSGCRWLEGELNDKVLARELGENPISKSQENLFGRSCLLSLFQFIKHAKFQGTVIGFDEAEQGFSVERRKMEKVLSMLKSGLDAIINLKDGSALILYAVTPDIVEKMAALPPLQQRVADPTVGRGFFDGETLAPKIDLAQQVKGEDPVKEIKAIGYRLVELLFAHAINKISIQKQDVYDKVDTIAADVVRTDISSSNRRTMVKRTCAMLLRLYNEGALIDSGSTDKSERNENEV